jgi:hypothetical protein
MIEQFPVVSFDNRPCYDYFIQFHAFLTFHKDVHCVPEVLLKTKHILKHFQKFIEDIRGPGHGREQVK